jgi:hypothetical protein
MGLLIFAQGSSLLLYQGLQHKVLAYQGQVLKLVEHLPATHCVMDLIPAAPSRCGCVTAVLNSLVD